MAEMPNFRAQCHTNVSKPEMLLDGVNVGQFKCRECRCGLDQFFSRRYEQHLKCKGSFKELPWKYKIFQAQRHRLNSFMFKFLRLLFADIRK